MKPIFYLAIAVLLTCTSCKMYRLPYTYTPTEPYVQLKNGDKYEGKTAERKQPLFGKDKITVGDTSFRTKNVAFYSTGLANYANIGKKTFATQVAAGKINLYRYSYSTSSTTHESFTSYSGMTSTSSHTSNTRHIEYYIQKDFNQALKGLNYKNLAPLVHQRTPEFKMLQKYKHARTATRIVGYGSLALIASGIALSKGDNLTGPALALGGIGGLFVYLPMHAFNKGKLLRTVLISDKDDNKSKHTARPKSLFHRKDKE